MFTQSQGLFFFLHCPATEEAGGAHGAGGDTDETSDTTDQRDMPDHVMSHSEIKLGKEEGTFRVSSILPFQSYKLQVIEPCFPRDS